MKALYAHLFLFFATTAAYAAPSSSILIEPSVGYRSETIRLTDLSQQETTLNSRSPVFGLKFGYRSPLGVDVNLGYDYSNGKMETSSVNEKNKFTHQTASAQLGINALGAMKIYLGYAFLNELKLEETASVAAFKLNGPSYLVGLQFNVIANLNLGAQYNLNQFKKISGSAYSLGDEIDDYFSKIDSQDYSLYLSLAF